MEIIRCGGERLSRSSTTMHTDPENGNFFFFGSPYLRKPTLSLFSSTQPWIQSRKTLHRFFYENILSISSPNFHGHCLFPREMNILMVKREYHIHVWKRNWKWVQTHSAHLQLFWSPALEFHHVEPIGNHASPLSLVSSPSPTVAKISLNLTVPRNHSQRLSLIDSDTPTSLSRLTPFSIAITYFHHHPPIAPIIIIHISTVPDHHHGVILDPNQHRIWILHPRQPQFQLSIRPKRSTFEFAASNQKVRTAALATFISVRPYELKDSYTTTSTSAPAWTKRDHWKRTKTRGFLSSWQWKRVQTSIWTPHE